jgi:chitinase
MLAYTSKTGASIWPEVDFVNVMSYDLMNRRDQKTAHHTSVAGCTQSINDYLAIGCPAEKLNLGFAYYAKYFTTAGDCSSSPLGCAIAPAEKADGSDALNSGAFTFEKSNMMSAANLTDLKVSTDGTCGPEKGKCASGCCSQYGSCGTTPEHCNVACQYAFGTGCQGPDIAGSWQKALVEGTCDEKEGGQYYFDASNKLFWTWDTTAIIERKYTEIVKEMGVGGIMAWSLGEDSYDWSHIKKLAELSGGSGGGYSTNPTTLPKPSTTPTQTPTTPSAVAPPPSQKTEMSAQPQQPTYSNIPVEQKGAENDDEYTTEQVCTTRRVKKRNVAAKPHMHKRHGHVGSPFLA